MANAVLQLAAIILICGFAIGSLTLERGPADAFGIDAFDRRSPEQRHPDPSRSAFMPSTTRRFGISFANSAPADARVAPNPTERLDGVRDNQKRHGWDDDGSSMPHAALPSSQSMSWRSDLLFWPVALAGTMIALQLVQLPPTLWTGLPGRAPILQGLALATVETHWLPVSLTPEATIAALLSLLPPLAMIVAIAGGPAGSRRDAVLILVGFAILSVGLGILQRVGGEDSALYAYAITNRGSATGLFANRNHLGSLMLCALPFVAAVARGGTAAIPHPPYLPRWMLAATGAAIIAAGAVLTGSRAAIGLLVPTAAGCAAILFHGRRVDFRLHVFGRRSAVLVVIMVGVLIGGVLAVVGLGSDFERESPAQTQHRSAIAATTMRAAIDHLPFGSGGGSFRTIYAGYEDPSAVTPEYVNHAHDDYLETVLEYGIPGGVAIVVVVIAWLLRTRAIWRVRGVEGDRARAGAVALGVLLLHSAVDYPLRTAAMAAVAGLAAALLAIPLPDRPVPDRPVPARAARKAYPDTQGATP